MTVSRDGEVPLRRSPARAVTALRAGALAALGIGRRCPSDQDAVRPLIAAHRRVFPGADADLLPYAGLHRLLQTLAAEYPTRAG